MLAVALVGPLVLPSPGALQVRLSICGAKIHEARPPSKEHFAAQNPRLLKGRNRPDNTPF